MISKRLIPYFVSVIGIVSDYFSSQLGLSLGFIESHVNYNPLNALFVFFSLITVLALTMPKSQKWNIAIIGFSLISFVGLINNVIVMIR